MKKRTQTVILALAITLMLLPLWAVHLNAAEVEYPLLQSLVYFPYSENTLLNKGELQGTADFYYSNFYRFNHERTFFNDFESFSTVLGLRYGLTQNSTFECFIRHTVIFGGILDKFIEDFHNAFGLPDADRPIYPRNHVKYYWRGIDPGEGFEYFDSKSALTSLTVAYLVRLLDLQNWQLKTRLAVGVPLSNTPGFSSGKFSITAGFVMDYNKNWFTASFSNHVAIFGTPGWLEGVDMKKVIWYSRLETRAFRIIVGLNFRTSAFKESIMSSNAYQIYVGYRISNRLTFIFQEDFAPFDTTPDIGFNLRWRFL